MCRCLNPDENLHQIDPQHATELTDHVERIREYWRTKKRFPFGICGPMWYGTPVVKDEAHHKIKRRYGVEMEIEFHRVTLDGETEYLPYYEQAAIVANNHLGLATKWGHGGITEDHSLDRGFEIILPAMSIRRIKRVLEPVLTDKHLYPFFRHGGNAAMHVTVDPFATPKQQKAFHDFWDHKDFFKYFILITDRDESSYCRQRKWAKEWRGSDGFMKADTLKSHYHRCNVRANGAMEVRVFQAQYSLDFLSQLSLVDDVVKLIEKGVYAFDDLVYELDKINVVYK